MEQQKDLIRDRIKQLGHVMLMQRKNFNRQLTNRATEQLCWYVESLHTLWRSSGDFQLATSSALEDYRAAVQKARYELGEERFLFDSRSSELGDKKMFKQIIKKKVQSSSSAAVLAAQLASASIGATGGSGSGGSHKSGGSKPWRKNATLPLLHVVASEGRLDMIKTLLEGGFADPNDPDSRGWTPLFHACARGFQDMTQELLMRGAHVNHQDLEGNSPLHICSLYGTENCAIILLRSAASVFLVNREGMTPLDLACRPPIVDSHEISQSLVRRLIEAGSEVHASRSSLPPEIASESSPEHTPPSPARGSSPISSHSSPIRPRPALGSLAGSGTGFIVTKPTALSNLPLSRDDGTNPQSGSSTPTEGHSPILSLSLTFEPSRHRKTPLSSTQPVSINRQRGYSVGSKANGPITPLNTFEESNDQVQGSSLKGSSETIVFAQEEELHDPSFTSSQNVTTPHFSTSSTSSSSSSSPSHNFHIETVRTRSGSALPIPVSAPVPSSMAMSDETILKEKLRVNALRTFEWQLQNPYLFICHSKGKKSGQWSKRTIYVTTDKIVFKKKKKNMKERPSCQLIHMERAIKKMRTLYVVWQFQKQPQRLQFRSDNELELFHQWAWWSSRLSVPPASLSSGFPWEQGLETIQIFVGTWNMGNTPPHVKWAEQWIPRRPGYDLYFIAVQESEFSASESNSCELSMTTQLQNHLGKAYIKLASLSLSGIRMFMMIRREFHSSVTNVKTGYVPTGVGGVMGNKGGVGVSFRFNETSLCFVGSHLAAHQGKIDQRNDNYRSIVRALGQQLQQSSSRKLDLNQQCDFIWWTGDLNYRIDMARPQVLQLIEARDWNGLYECDQLALQLKEESAFVGYKEEEMPQFPPTYKYEPGSTDRYSDEKMRVPAWCDRVLIKCNGPSSHVVRTSYGCCDEVCSSDHHPVFSTFTVQTLVPPRPSVLPQKFRISITDLKIDGLRFSFNEGTPSPYIKFIALYLPSDPTIQTTVKTKTRSPDWSSDEAICLYPSVQDLQFISRCPLHLLICDSRKQSSETHKTLRLAQTVISIADRPSSNPFSSQLTSGGYSMCGVVSGVVHVEIVDSRSFVPPSSLSSAASDSTSSCSSAESSSS